ncbi:MAG: beta-lactamase family protein [Clostridiales bacterium]|nr:beta-lactamase family protein [Clostridiales bacterium]
MDFNKLDKFLDNALFMYDLPGLAVQIGYGDKKYTKSLGYKDYIQKIPLEDQHIFHMASISKLLVGTSIMLLWEDGKIDLNEKLITYLPWFEIKDPRYKKITIRQLLSHTAGLPDVENYNWDKPETDDQALERYVRSDEVRESILLWDPEEKRFAYSNIGYEILGTVIATVSGMTFEDFVHQNIFNVLDMKDSSMLTFKRDMSQVCSPHVKSEDKEIVLAPHFPYNRRHAPSSTFTSNLNDLGKLAKANLNKTILKPETYEVAWESQAIVPNNKEHICLSWFRREQKGHIFYGHEGSDDGFRSSFWICPELDLYIAVCSNISNAPVKRINKELFNIISS